MIVLEIIMIMAVIGVPQLLRAMMSAREGSAAGSMKQIVNAQAGFKEARFSDQDNNGEGDYGSLAQLADPDGNGTTPGFIDPDLSSGIKSGYVFTVTVVPGNGTTPPSFTCLGIPVRPGQSAYKMYFVDDSGILRATNNGNQPGPTSPPI
jgi:hypothetical protein